MPDLFKFDGDVMSAENAKRQFTEITNHLKEVAAELMKTPEGRASLRRDIAAMQGRLPSEVKFEGE